MNPHTVTILLVNGANTVFYRDQSVARTLAIDSNTYSKPQYFHITNHITSNTNWGAGTSGSLKVNYYRVWRLSTAKHWAPQTTLPDLYVDYAGTNSVTLPSASAIWGDSPSEYIQIYPGEANNPGMTSALSFQDKAVALPPGVTWNSSTRVLKADFTTTTGFNGNAGMMPGLLYGYTTDGSTGTPARFTIFRGPNIAETYSQITLNNPASIDLYPSCDVGTLTPKTMSVLWSGSSNGLSFSPSTFLVTGTPTANSTATVTCTNNVGQAQSVTYTFGTCAYANVETCNLVGRFDTQPDNAHLAYIDTAISCFKSASVWASRDVIVAPLNTAYNSLLNWKGVAYSGTVIGSVSFAAYSYALTS